MCAVEEKSIAKFDSSLKKKLSAFPVHGLGGLWGVFATGLFDMDKGVFYGGDVSDILGPNIVGIIAIVVWAAVTTIPVFLALRKYGLLRYSEEQQLKGLDTKFTPESPPH